MLDQRHVRFATVEGLRPSDLPMAGEIWLDDVSKSTWQTREAIKIAGYMVRYMDKPALAPMSLAAIEGQLQLSPEQTKVTLKLMLMFGALETLSVVRDEIRAIVRLPLLLRLKTLEAQCRLEELMRKIGTDTPQREPVMPQSVAAAGPSNVVELAAVATA